MTSSTTSTDESSLPEEPRSPFLRKYLNAPPMSPEEVERRRLGAERFKRLYSSNPLWKAKEDADPNFWHHFYSSQPNS
jgi:hypothetical protein